MVEAKEIKESNITGVLAEDVAYLNAKYDPETLVQLFLELLMEA